LKPSPHWAEWESTNLNPSAVELNDQQRRVVENTILEHCRVRTWDVIAMAVRTNHVHCMLSFPLATPERIMIELKSWSTRALRREGLIAANSRVWARHGSTKYLWDEASIQAAGAYIVEGQDVPR
jgi:REP element-mobilizing transposase RayT